MFGLVVGVVESSAISIRHDVPEQDYFDLAGQFPAAGSVRRNNGRWCSGSLVAPDKVLTAAHCTSGVSAGQLSFRLGANVANSGTSTHVRSVSAVSISPNYTGNERSDLSVLTLSSPINDVTPLPISLQDPSGLVGTMVGYGDHGNGLNFNFASDNLQRAAQNMISVATALTVRTDFDHPDGTTSTYAPSTALPLEGTTAGGDSGGPLTADFGQGEVIVGVLHGGFNNFGLDSRYGDISIWAPINRPANVSYLESLGLTVMDGTISGDFDNDGDFDCVDVDALVAEIASGGNSGSFDMTGDGNVNGDDLNQWLEVAGTNNVGGPFLPGDADLSGVVDFLDFNQWSAHRFTSDPSWCSGDFNASGVIDFLDFNIWAEFRFQSSTALAEFDAKTTLGADRIAATAVPEPGGWFLGGWGCAMVSRRRRKVVFRSAK
jgi:hypothetical protein